MEPASLPERVTALEHGLYGPRGDNGIAGDLRELRDDFQRYVKEQAKQQEASDSQMKTVLIGVLVTAGTTIVTLLTLLAQQG